MYCSTQGLVAPKCYYYSTLVLFSVLCAIASSNNNSTQSPPHIAIALNHSTMVVSDQCYKTTSENPPPELLHKEFMSPFLSPLSVFSVCILQEESRQASFAQKAESTQKAESAPKAEFSRFYLKSRRILYWEAESAQKAEPRSAESAQKAEFAQEDGICTNDVAEEKHWVST